MICWAMSDGRAGIEIQALGLANAVAGLARRSPGAPSEILVTPVHVTLPAPWRSIPTVAAPSVAVVGLARKLVEAHGPPDIVIACGRQAALVNIALGEVAPLAFRVQLQAPRAPLNRFDMVIAPSHDGLVGENVVSILGSTHGMTPSVAQAAADALLGKAWRRRETRRSIAFAIGGPNKSYRFDAATGEALAAAVSTALGQGRDAWVTASRRTPAAAWRALSTLRQPMSSAGADGTIRALYRPDDPASAATPNPYPGLLALATDVVVTIDSVNMACEAASAGARVHLFGLPRSRGGGTKTKFEAFHAELVGAGRARWFDGAFPDWTPPPDPFDETGRAATAVLSAWRRRDAI